MAILLNTLICIRLQDIGSYTSKALVLIAFCTTIRTWSAFVIYSISEEANRALLDALPIFIQKESRKTRSTVIR